MPTITYKRPVLYTLQENAFFCKERYSICEASTKSGKTHGCIAWLFERALLGKEGSNHWWVAPVLGQARIAFRRMLRALTPYKHLIEVNRSLMEITVIGAGTMAFKTAENPDSLYGEDVHSLVTDEASRCKLEAFAAMRSTLTFTQGLWRLIGNVKGRKNEFYRMAQIAKSGAENYRYTKITAYDAVAAGVLPAEEIEDAKALLPEPIFRELYLAEPGEDGGNPFGLSSILRCIQPDWYTPEMDPLGNPVGCEAIGIDLGKAQDYTAVIALDDAGNTLYWDNFRTNWQDTIDSLASVIRNLSPSGPVLVDSTGVGDPILENLQIACPGYMISGFKFSQQSKQQVMEGLASAIQHEELSFPAGEIVDQLESYEYTVTQSMRVLYSAPEGVHDDLVAAMALANRALRQERVEWDW